MPTKDAGADAGSIGENAIEVGKRFVYEQEFRREALEASLLNAENAYARERLEHYAVVDGWDELPEMRPQVSAVRFESDDMVFDEPSSLFAKDVPWTESDLLQLGKRAFEAWPAQTMPELELELRNLGVESTAQQRGLSMASDGSVAGLVAARYESGATVIAATCATCHARVDKDGVVEHGPASNIELDFRTEPRWAAGTLDVTADGIDNPVAIPDLRATAHQTRLHWTGNLRNGLSALAVRIDTLLITNAATTARPPRQVAFALAYYVQQLGGTSTSLDGGADRATFDEHCGRCHRDATGAGDWIDVDEVGTDALAAESSRGTGGFRVPSLHRVVERTHLTHEGWPLPMVQFLPPSRLATYPGHEYGLSLSASEQSRLTRFLGTL